MQYPQIQFYKGSLVRLASGELKQVQDLSSDDFLESARLIRTSSSHHLNSNQQQQQQHLAMPGTSSNQMQQSLSNEDLSAAPEEIYADSSVVRDFLEVGPSVSPNAPSSPTSSISSQTTQPDSLTNQQQASTPTGNIHYHYQQQQQHSVLIKFFLESSRSTVFIEVPIEHPFFVFHRGWSSWNPQRTYDKFGLKCRKLKIGDTCISLIRSRSRKQQQQQQQQQQQHQQQQQQQQQHQQQTHLSNQQNFNHNHNNHHHHHHQQESEQFNMLFSSIKFDV